MSVYQNLYVGPYAQWLVKGKVDDDALSELLEDMDHALLTNARGLADHPPEVRVKRARYRCYCFMPEADRPNKPKRPNKPEREMWFNRSIIRVEDWTELGRKLEADWLAHAFAEELGRLAGFFGSPPSLRWGMVAWLS